MYSVPIPTVFHASEVFANTAPSTHEVKPRGLMGYYAAAVAGEARVVLSCSSMKDGKKVGITAGTFDLCHAGHMLVFKEAKTVCDYLIVARQDDPSKTQSDYSGKKKNTPIMLLEERRIILEGIRYI